jgi:uncharacterized protein
MNQRKLIVLSGLSGILLGALALALGYYLWNGVNGTKLELYSARTIVTGQRDETRLPGFLIALLDVAKKVSGDHTITAAQVESIAHGNVQLYVKTFHDHDRMEDIPIHDEQGTRDRSFDLLVDFVPGKVDALLRVLGRKPWTEARPKILVLLRVRNATAEYLLINDEEDWQGTEQREAFQNAAWQAGLPLLLPAPTFLTKANLTAANFDQISTAQLKGILQSAQADVIVKGHLNWVGGANGWKADWTMVKGDSEHHWQIDGANFDGAFRNAMRGAAHILSGHGEPPPNLN